MTKFRTLDVRPMLARGEEPYPEIRKRVAALVPGIGLSVVAPFLPAPLVERLRSEGYETRVERLPDGSWAAFFWRDKPG